MSASITRDARRPAREPWLAGPWTPVLWAAASAAAYVASAFGAIVVTLPIREFLPAADQLSLPVAWTLLAALGALAAARVCFGAWPRVTVEAAVPPLLATVAGVIASVLALGGNLPGLADGLDPESVIPAWTIGAAAAYVLQAGAVADLDLAGAGSAGPMIAAVVVGLAVAVLWVAVIGILMSRDL